MPTIQDIIADPRYHDYLAILKGARNGIVYGVKIRFPHALLMSILFGRGDVMARARQIVRLTTQHALNLAKFVSLYKIILLLQKKFNDGKERSSDTFIAGLLGGYIVFGDRSAVNEQIVLYVCSRVVASFIPRASSPPLSPGSPTKPLPPDARNFSIFAALSWGAVMWLFKNRGETIQPGMFSSMKYLYQDSEKWDGMRTLLWRNK
ncbi:peroxisomal membrane protein 4 [Rickenella mellea]|uniref:Peroxisomal membrane protein 4 n=1 Tax=Rickenella mellea TaxID=50990 RepID=A0A4Y7QMG6_9AGAM|nr:peroxisomal membrane protein 4 [Rickenella mellea]